jgi:hypothetical protein
LSVEGTGLTIDSRANRSTFSGWNIVQQVLAAPIGVRGDAFLNLSGCKTGVSGVGGIEAKRQHALMASLHVAVELNNLRADALIRIRTGLPLLALGRRVVVTSRLIVGSATIRIQDVVR